MYKFVSISLRGCTYARNCMFEASSRNMFRASKQAAGRQRPKLTTPLAVGRVTRPCSSRATAYRHVRRQSPPEGHIHLPPSIRCARSPGSRANIVRNRALKRMDAQKAANAVVAETHIPASCCTRTGQPNDRCPLGPREPRPVLRIRSALSRPCKLQEKSSY